MCPWRGNASPASLAALLLPGQRGMPPSLPHGTLTAREDIKMRTARLLRLPVLPALAESTRCAWEACTEACGFGDDFVAWRCELLHLVGFARSDSSSLSESEAERRNASLAHARRAQTSPRLDCIAVLGASACNPA